MIILVLKSNQIVLNQKLAWKEWLVAVNFKQQTHNRKIYINIYITYIYNNKTKDCAD